MAQANNRSLLKSAAYQEELLTSLGRIAAEMQQRAYDKFEADYGCPYDGSRDDDWDKLDKSYTQIEQAMDFIRAYGRVSARIEELAA